MELDILKLIIAFALILIIILYCALVKLANYMFELEMKVDRIDHEMNYFWRKLNI